MMLSIELVRKVVSNDACRQHLTGAVDIVLAHCIDDLEEVPAAHLTFMNHTWLYMLVYLFVTEYEATPETWSCRAKTTV